MTMDKRQFLKISAGVSIAVLLPNHAFSAERLVLSIKEMHI
jgi:hypothetical protein